MNTQPFMAGQQGCEDNPFATPRFQPRLAPTPFGARVDYLPFSRQKFQPQLTPPRFDPFAALQTQQFRPDTGQLRPTLAFANGLRFLGSYEPFRLSRKLSQRIIELSALEQGWDGKGAAAPRPDTLAHTIGLILVLQTALPEFEEPFVVPTIDGFMQLEWHSGQRALEFEATANGWSIVGSETKPRGERVYYETDTARFDVDTLLAAYRWFVGLELWPII